MKKILFAVLAGLCFAQPAAAVSMLGDFDVYAKGNAHISGGAYGDIASGSFSNANGPTGKNFTSQQAATANLNAQATALSNSYAALTPTGAFSELWGAGTLTGTQAGINVFTISVSQIQPLHKLSFTGPGDGAIVNITGTGSMQTSIKFDLGAITDPSKFVLNFVDIDSVWFDGLNLKGSILAPDAALRLQGGTVAGSAIAKSFHSEGTVFGGTPYSGFSPAAAPAVPEPSTWMLLILGFGLVGVAMRRRAAAAMGLAAA